MKRFPFPLLRTPAIIFAIPLFTIAGARAQEEPTPAPTEEPAPAEIAPDLSLPEKTAEPPVEEIPEPRIEEPVQDTPFGNPPAADPTPSSDPSRTTETFEGRTGTFDFVAADPASLQIARRIGRVVLDACDELISPPEERMPVLSVKLAPDGRGDLEGEKYRIYEDVAGDYGLAVAWNENLPVSLFIQALTESYLRQLVYTLSDRDRAETVPSWLIAGVSLRVQVALRPALIEYLREFGREQSMLPLEELLAPRPLRDLGAGEQVGAFWFLELITRTLDDKKRIRNYFDAVVAGGPPLDVLQSQAQGIRAFANGVEAWWVIGFQDLVHRQTGIVLSIDRSGKQLYLLNRFELINEGSPAFTTVAGLWEYRGDPLIQRALSDRLQEIRQILPRVNPIFYNAFRSLGLQMQALLDGDSEAFETQTSEFSTETATAAALARDAQILAENPASEL